ncbi:MAG TPA: AAA family ATPase [Ruminiclostridium sp.]|nr:AAA family ATPase [Ruminiclostridium sp.]
MAEIRRSLDNIFAAKRERALIDAERRKKEAYAKIPRLAELDAEITLAGIRFARRLLSQNNPDDGYTLDERISFLNAQKEALLKTHGLPVNFMEPVFSCPACEDRGYIAKSSGESVPCSCYQKLYLEQLYAYSNILDDGQTGFEFFDETFFSDKLNAKRYQVEISPREQILGIKHQCEKFVENFPDKETPNFYFFGSIGTGKTFMAKSIGLELVKRGYSVLYLSAPSLFSTIQQYRISSDKDVAENEQAYKNLITVNLLILDDLGTEPKSDARYAEFLTLLEMRKGQSRNHTAKTIISSNFDLKRLFQEYNERIASRIVGEFQAFQFIGDDIRLIKRHQQQWL